MVVLVVVVVVMVGGAMGGDRYMGKGKRENKVPNRDIELRRTSTYTHTQCEREHYYGAHYYGAPRIKKLHAAMASTSSPGAGGGGRQNGSRLGDDKPGLLQDVRHSTA